MAVAVDDCNAPHPKRAEATSAALPTNAKGPPEEPAAAFDSGQ